MFSTGSLQEEIVMTGTVLATLYVSSDQIDTDFMVKISDVYPTGEERIIEDNAVRMRWREGGLEPIYMEKGQVYKVEMDLWNTSYVIAQGHALKVSVASSNYPRFSVNPNNGLLLNDANYPGENITATNTIYLNKDYPSKISLPIVDKSSMPETDVLHEIRKEYPQITEELIQKGNKQIPNMMKRFSH